MVFYLLLSLIIEHYYTQNFIYINTLQFFSFANVSYMKIKLINSKYLQKLINFILSKKILS